jgi:hypothetical protein
MGSTRRHFGFLTPIGAERQIIVHRFPKFLIHLCDTLALESDHVLCVDHFAMKQRSLIIELELPDVSLYSIMPSQ